jgi:2-dehydro-3-deoxygluconokinase
MKPGNVVCFGELLMRLHAPGGQRFTATRAFDILYTGSEANVSALLSLLGQPVAFASKVPDNDFGVAALRELQALKINTANVVLGGDKLGLYFTEAGTEIRPARVLYDRAHSSFANLAVGEINWEALFEGAAWFHWSGISAAVSQAAAAVCYEALCAAKKAGVKISADFNYRSTLWKWGKKPSEVMPELLAFCDVMVCDLDAAAVYLDIKPLEGGDKETAFLNCVQQLRSRFTGLETVAMSFRKTGESGGHEYSACLAHGPNSYFSNAADLGTIVDRIGSGDAFTAGLIFGLLQGFEPGRLINFATACGALKHTVPGDIANISRSEIESFLQGQGRRGTIIR